MATKDEALALALEALEKWQSARTFHERLLASNNSYAAITAIKQAQQAQEPVHIMPKGASAAPQLLAMAANYQAGHLWDKLDAQACIKGALEIEALRAAAPKQAELK